MILLLLIDMEVIVMMAKKNNKLLLTGVCFSLLLMTGCYHSDSEEKSNQETKVEKEKELTEEEKLKIEEERKDEEFSKVKRFASLFMEQKESDYLVVKDDESYRNGTDIILSNKTISDFINYRFKLSGNEEMKYENLDEIEKDIEKSKIEENWKRRLSYFCKYNINNSGYDKEMNREFYRPVLGYYLKEEETIYVNVMFKNELKNSETFEKLSFKYKCGEDKDKNKEVDVKN